jgi:hypothetical protein
VRIARSFAALLVVVAVAASGNAGAAEPDARAKSRALFLQGVAALDDTRPREALAMFEHAYELFPHYSTLYNIGICHRALAQNADAANALQRYLDEGGAASPSEESVRVKALLAELDGKTATLTVSVTPVVRMTLDGRPLSVGAPVRVEPGEHVVEAADSGTRASRTTLNLRAGERRALALDLSLESGRSSHPVSSPPATAPPVPPPGADEPAHGDAPQRLNTTFWIAAGTSGVGLATFAIAGLLASSAQSAYEKAPTDAEANSEKSRGKDLALVADVGLIVSLVAGALAVVIAVRPMNDPARRTVRMPIVPRIGPGHASIDYELRF